MNILLGVTGGIAAYKACELVSLSLKADHQVRVIMTANAQRFVGSLTFEGLTGHRAMVGTFDHAMDHIDWAKWADVACVAPATANVLAKLAHGLADDALTTTLLALPAPKQTIIAPAMNTEMWNHPATQRNLEIIDSFKRFVVVAPVEKRLACGDYGTGGMAEPQEVLDALG